MPGDVQHKTELTEEFNLKKIGAVGRKKEAEWYHIPKGGGKMNNISFFCFPCLYFK